MLTVGEGVALAEESAENGKVFKSSDQEQVGGVG